MNDTKKTEQAIVHKFVHTGLFGFMLESIEVKPSWNDYSQDISKIPPDDFLHVCLFSTSFSEIRMDVSFYEQSALVFAYFYKSSDMDNESAFGFESFLSFIGKRHLYQEIYSESFARRKEAEQQGKQVLAQERQVWIDFIYELCATDLLKVIRGEEWPKVPHDWSDVSGK